MNACLNCAALHELRPEYASTCVGVRVRLVVSVRAAQRNCLSRVLFFLPFSVDTCMLACRDEHTIMKNVTAKNLKPLHVAHIFSAPYDGYNEN